MSRLGSRVLVGVLIGLVLMAVRAAAGHAHHEAPLPANPWTANPYAHYCADTDTSCMALAERLEVIADGLNSLDNTTVRNEDLLTLIEANTTGGGGGEVTESVALTGDSQVALEDLRMVAAWTMGLLVAGLLLMPILLRTFARNA